MKISVDRLANQIKKNISEIINEANNDKLKLITITNCKLNSDKSICKIYYMSQSTNSKQELDKAKSYISRELSHRIDFRKTPKLEFIYDNSYDNGMKIDSVLDRL